MYTESEEEKKKEQREEGPAADSCQSHELCGQRKEPCGSFNSYSLGFLPGPGLWANMGVRFFVP